jgi:hypothetical protein
VLLKQIVKNRVKDFYNYIAPESIKTESKLSKNKAKELTLGWIKELVSYFNKVDKIAENIEVKKIHNELFLIRNE